MLFKIDFINHYFNNKMPSVITEKRQENQRSLTTKFRVYGSDNDKPEDKLILFQNLLEQTQNSILHTGNITHYKTHYQSPEQAIDYYKGKIYILKKLIKRKNKKK